jgi:hypothetical protein
MFSDGNAGSDYAVVEEDGRAADRAARSWRCRRRLVTGRQWALGIITSTSKLVVLRIGAGELRLIATDPVTSVQNAGWLADSKSIVIFGSEPGKPPRHYRVSMSGGAPVPILPENLAFAMFAPNGEIAIGSTGDGAFAIYPLAGGAARPIAGLDATDEPIAFSEDSRSIFVQKAGRLLPAVVDRIDLVTGRRTMSWVRSGQPCRRGWGVCDGARDEGRRHAVRVRVHQASVRVVCGDGRVAMKPPRPPR